MKEPDKISIAYCKPIPKEQYGDTCKRLEEVVKIITDNSNITYDAVIVLAYVLMEAPADFDHNSMYNPPPFKRSKDYLKDQSRVVRDFFESECKKNPRRNESRIRALLSITS